MKILLIQPAKAALSRGIEEFSVYEPLALEYVAAGVTEDHDVRILDLRLESNLERVFADLNPDVVGITAYTVHVNTVRRLCDQIKEWNPSALTVVGGHHATLAPEDFLSTSIDLIVMGEGVSVFREIVRRFESGNGFDGIPGIAFARAGRLIKTGYSPQIDLDAFPFPDRGLTSQYRRRYNSGWMKPLASMRTSKGCPYRCRYCATWKAADGRYLKRDPGQIVEELATIEEEFVFFADDESLIDAAGMATLARRIEQAGIHRRYFLYGRADTIARNPDLLALWKAIGLERILVGLEFCRDRDLEYVRKDLTVSDHEAAVQILQALDIELLASFILRPEFTRDDFAALRRYCHDLRLSLAIFSVLTPLPGTDLAQEVEAQLLTRNYDFFDLLHTVLPTELPLKDFYRELSRLYGTAISPAKGIAIVGRYPLREIPGTLVRFYHWLYLLRRTYRDYERA